MTVQVKTRSEVVELPRETFESAIRGIVEIAGNVGGDAPTDSLALHAASGLMTIVAGLTTEAIRPGAGDEAA